MRERFFDSLNYSSVNEDWRTEAEALRLGADSRVLCVTGSGDRALDLLAVAPARVVAIDLSAPQGHLLALKVAAMRSLSFDEYAAFLGLHAATRCERAATYNRLAPSLPPAARAYWDGRARVIEAGVLYQGRFERYFRRVARLSHALRPGAIDALFAFDDIEAQRRFVRERWDTPAWRFVYRALASPSTSRALLRDPAFYAHPAVPVGDYLYDRMRAHLERCLARDSFMMNLVLRGDLGADLPPYLTPDGVARIRERLGGLSVVTGDVVEHLRESRQCYTHLSLSDVPSYMAEADVDALYGAVLLAGAPGARVVVREFLTRYGVPEHIAPYLDREPALERRLALEDRSFAYEFVIATLRTSRAPGPAGPSRVCVDTLREEDEAEALALERACVQGESLRLSFRRERFQRRAEGYDAHVLLAARVDGRLVGTAGVGFKDVVVRGEPMRASFYFDLRVHPDYRGRAIARHLTVESLALGLPRSDFAYCYTVADNRAVIHMTRASSMRVAGGYAYLVLPTYKSLASRQTPRAASRDEVYARMLEAAGPFDFYADPRRGAKHDACVGSFLIERGAGVAGCSAWDNRAILAEVVEALPAPLRVARAVLETPALRGHGPHLPAPGEALRSWYLFDAFATDAELAVDLVRHVVAEARAHGVDYCYLIHAPGAPWVDAVRAAYPKLFAPIVPYHLFAMSMRPGPLAPFTNAYVDVRDV